MFHEILEQVEAAINKQMTDKFGLTAEQTKESTNVFREVFQNFVSNGGLKNPQFIQEAIQNVQALQDNEVIVKLKENLAKGLQEKAGLSPELAAAVRDFSISEFYKTVAAEFTDDHGNLDINKVLGKINMQELEQTAKSLLGNFGAFGNIFKK